MPIRRKSGNLLKAPRIYLFILYLSNKVDYICLYPKSVEYYGHSNKVQFLPSSDCVDTAIWMHYMDATKRLEKKLDGNNTRIMGTILNKSWRQHPTKQQLYSHLPPVTKAIEVRRTRRAGNCWRSRDELWTPSHGRAKAGRPARTYTQQLRV